VRTDGGKPLVVSVLVPAYNEAERVGSTVCAIRGALQAYLGHERFEILVIDDGSSDETAARAQQAGATRVICLPHLGKGTALEQGRRAARGAFVLMLDADLGESAGELGKLLAPVREGEADMTIARFPPARGGGMGLALRLARWGVERATGRRLEAPLSGQRATRREHLDALAPIEPGFGAEVGLDIDALRAGLRVLEVPTTMSHAATGRDWRGFLHRGRQFLHIARALLRRTLGARAGAAAEATTDEHG
jgi:glycosyltransferase involved in cell wall biosynthesis